MKILIVREKHGDTIYNASTQEALYANALYHLKNTTMDYLVNDGTPKKFIEQAERALNEKDGKLALNILQSRSNYEYEEVSLQTVLDFSEQK